MSAIPAYAVQTTVDAGFENGTDGVTLSAPWILSGAPQRYEYDTARAKNGSRSGWVQGPSAAAYAGVGETVTGGMTANGAEQRFWVYFDSANQFRVFDDWSSLTADRAFSLQFGNDGSVNVFTNRPGNPNGYMTGAYTRVGTYTAGWNQFQIVYDFATQSYTLAKRTSDSDPWTALKASGATGNAIPFRGVNTITSSHGILFRSYQGANMWIDDLKSANEGVIEVDVSAPTVPGSLAAADVAGDQGGATSLSWVASTDNVGVTGYKIYRGTSAGSYETPITVFSLTSYTDATAVTGTRYYYAVSALDAAGNESAKSAEVSAVALDNLAPAVPTGLSATGGTKQAVLVWTANAESDLAGYNVYRNGTKVNASLVSATSYSDTGLYDGMTYSYAIKAVDVNGNESAASGAASAQTLGTPPPASNLDGTFESGTDGVSLSPPWIIVGAAQHAEYDSARAKSGTLSGWIQGPATAAYAGVGENASAGMFANGAEQRFWLYFDTNNQFRTIDDYAGVTADRALFLQFTTDGKINTFTNRTGDPNGYPSSAYNQIGTYSVGWTEFRVVYDFASQTYTLSKRANVTEAWTPLKGASAPNAKIPFRGANTITQTHGLLFRSYQNANMWVDDLRYASGGFIEHTITATSTVGGSISPSSQIVSDGGDSSAFTITPAANYQIADVQVDGASVGRLNSYTFSKVTAPHVLSVTFRHVAGTTEMSMEGVDCDTCHAPHGFDIACGECHDIAVYHRGTPSDIHVPSPSSACTSCHNASLTVEHNGRITPAGETVTCATCHQSTNPAVVAAIQAKDSKCVSCHGPIDHATIHAFTAGADVNADGNAGCTNSGSGCHGTDATRETFVTYHPNNGCTNGNCHYSASQPSYKGNGDCQSCHAGNYAGAPARADLPNEHYRETTHTAVGLGTVVSTGGKASATCADCHNPVANSGPNGLVAQHTNVGIVAGSTYGSTVSCVECHNDTRANGNAQVLAGWTSNQCADCHSVTSSAPMHGTTAPSVLATSTKGCGESGTHCHGSYDVHQLHKDAAGGCSLAGCHDYSKQGGKPTITTCGDAGGCHSQSGVDYHFSIADKHTSPTVGSCFASGCHPASKDLADVHATFAGPGSENAQYKTACDLCHNNSDPNRIDWTTANARCNAQCHSGETHTKLASSHALTAASTECVSCHGSDLVAVHGASTDVVKCATCHARPSNYSATADCTGCHNATGVGAHAYTPADPNHYTAGGHSATPFTAAAQGDGFYAGGQECSACHSQSLSEAHGAISTSAGKVTCVECHTASTLGIKAFGSPSWPNKTCTSCHTPKAVHAAYETSAGMSAAHKATSAQGCGNTGASCHTSYELGAVHSKAPNGCLTCHGVDKSMSGEKKTCGEVGGCHVPGSYHVGLHL